LTLGAGVGHSLPKTVGVGTVGRGVAQSHVGPLLHAQLDPGVGVLALGRVVRLAVVRRRRRLAFAGQALQPFLILGVLGHFLGILNRLLVILLIGQDAELQTADLGDELFNAFDFLGGRRLFAVGPGLGLLGLLRDAAGGQDDLHAHVADRSHGDVVQVRRVD